MRRSCLIVVMLVFVTSLTRTASAQGDEAKLERLRALTKHGPCTVELGDQATLRVPVGFNFLPPEGAQLFDELNQNLPSIGQVGTIVQTDGNLYLKFWYDEIGRVPDDDRSQLDANAILASLRSKQEVANVKKRAKGWSAFHLDGWQIPPNYNQGLKRLEWCTLHHSDDGSRVANFNTRLLGRSGVMTVKGVESADEMPKAIPQINQVLAGFEFKSGKKWAEWKAGDKTASYGLVSLITGGAAVVAAKSGFLAKFGKFIAAGVVGLLALLGSVFGTKQPNSPQQ